MDDVRSQQLFLAMSNVLWFQGVIALLIMVSIGVRLWLETLTPADEHLPGWRRMCLVIVAAIPLVSALKDFQEHLRAVASDTIMTFTLDYMNSGDIHFVFMWLSVVVLSAAIILSWKPEKKSCCATGCGCK